MRLAYNLLIAVSLVTIPAMSQSASSYVSRTIAGVFPLGDGGPATAALLETPQAVAANSSGTIYIADSGNGVLRKVSKGVISGVPEYTGGYIYDLKLDAAGNLYIATGTYVFKLTPTGGFGKIVGNGSTTTYTGDGGPAADAGFSGIYSIAVDKDNNLYIGDANNHAIRKVTPDGIVRTIAGKGKSGFRGDDGPALEAQFNFPRNLAVDGQGSVYINDYNNNRVRKITSDGVIKTIAGSAICCSSPDGGLASNAYLVTGPVTTDPSGNVYVFDYLTNRIRRVTPSGILQAFAGDGKEGFSGDGDSAPLARFSRVAGMGTDALNNVYVVDSNNERIRMISSGGTITTVAGRGHYAGDNGPATAALLHRPTGLVQGSDGSTYFADTMNHRVRKIAPDGKITTYAGTGEVGFGGDGGQATQALLSYPDAVALDQAGNLYVVDQSQVRVRKIAPDGVISTIAGNGNLTYSVDGGGAKLSGFGYIGGIVVDAGGNIYLSESAGNRIKKITPAGGLSTYAGAPVNGNASGFGFSGDGLSAAQAVFANPTSLAMDGAGNLYISDLLNYRIRRIASGTGTVSTVAGIGKCCSSGNGGKATQAMVDATGMFADSDGGLWFTDSAGVRYIGRDGIINRISGGDALGFAGDDQPASAATRYLYPNGIGLNKAGEVIIADTDNSRIRKLQPNDASRMDVVSGNNQTGTVGVALDAFIVKLMGKAGIGAGGVPVTYAVTAGAADLTAKNVTTDASGAAGIAATPTKTGTLTVTATSGTFSAVFTATIKDAVVIPPPPDPNTPVISPGGIGQNGFSVPAVAGVSTGGITTIYGSNFMAAGSAPQVNAIAGGTLATKFAGICVTFGGVKAPIFGAATTQITVEVPEVTAGPVEVQVLRNCGETGELKSNTLTATAQGASPEFLYLTLAADGRNPVAAVTAEGGFVGAPGSIPSANLRPAKAGDVLVIYALGLGATNPGQTVGAPAPGIGSVTLPYSITVGGVAVAAADIFYVGVSPTYLGLYQVNLRVPENVPSGNQPIIIQVGAAKSPAGGFLTLQ
ncbi:MAG: IPT/TIG domain-containing protein [Candidatus Solibacter sp.]